MSQNECSLKLKMVIEEEEPYEMQVKFSQWNILQETQPFNYLD
jgi:hypothetical protein